MLRLRDLGTYPRRFEAFVNDRFGLRGALLRGRAAIAWYGLRTSPTDKLVRGRADWVFYTADESLEVHCGVRPLSPGALDAWTRMLRLRSQWLAGLGIEFVFALVPNKSHIYPEFMPRRLGPPRRTRLDQWVDHLRAVSELRILDLRAPLRAAKRDDRPALDDWGYARLGTHWSERGAFAGYRALMDPPGRGAISSCRGWRPATSALWPHRTRGSPGPRACTSRGS